MKLTFGLIKEVKEFIFGKERIGSQYIFPLEFERRFYLEKKVERSGLGIFIAFLDLVIYLPLKLIIVILKKFMGILRQLYVYLKYDDSARKYESELMMVDWNGVQHTKKGAFRDRKSMVAMRLDVNKKDDLFSDVVKI